MKSAFITWQSELLRPGLYRVLHADAWNGEADDSLLLVPNSNVIGGDCGYLMSEDFRRESKFAGRGIALDELPPIDDGDVVLVRHESNRLELVFQVKSVSNVLFLTNGCNSRCAFCPQPSSNDDGYYYELAKNIIDLVPHGGECVNITGGEPTLCKDKFLEVLSHAACKWNDTRLFVLTNGRNCCDGSFVDELFRIRTRDNIGFAVPLYSDAGATHDQIVGAAGAFGQTMRGLYNLAVHGAEIEIRIVVSKLNYARLPQLIDYIGRNLPFVARVAIMGLEPMGYCRTHWEDFWIDPEAMAVELRKAVEVGCRYGLNTKLYNFQLCCIDASIQDLACSSISEWKRTYLDECLTCTKRHLCGGFFASQNRPKYRPKKFANGFSVL